MSGVWVFKNGVVRLVENNAVNEQQQQGQGQMTRRKVLVDSETGQVINSYAALERKLRSLGWERYYDDPQFFQFHKRSSVDLISLPKDFSNFKSLHMYDIVIKNRNSFQVTDM
ncbi:Flowering-promoting factor 1-like protein 1 [Stylosanthes scabra]|uniref:Flowering-promoting factor 1-like protein 1 n=1 Tax=Stylosanthes scabra TaxID=79078 RepID=A0ABU6VNB5_9FABA|nr:Flowering-promoting factor 1-like protein 1 [Stylosanthes scabra]